VRDYVIKFWFEWLFGILLAVLGLAYRHVTQRVKKTSTENAALRDGMIVLLRDRLVQAHNYYTEKGSWPLHSRDSVEAMYLQYMTLGGNGTIARLITKLHDLPIETRKEEIK